MTSTGNKGAQPIQDVISIPVDAAPNEALFTSLQRLEQTGTGGHNIPYRRTYDARQDSIFFMDLVCVLKQQAAEEVGVFSQVTGAAPRVVANVNGMPAGKPDAVTYVIGDTDEKAVQRQHLLYKYKAVGRADANWNSAGALEQGSDSGLIGINMHGFGDFNLVLDQPIAHFTQVCLALPVQQQDEAPNNINMGSTHISRTAFTVKPFSTQDVSDYSVTSLATYLNNAFGNSKKDDIETPASFFDIRNTERHHDCILGRNVTLGHNLALGMVGIGFRFLLTLIELGHLQITDFSTDPTVASGRATAGKAASSIVEKQMGEFFGLISMENGDPSPHLKTGLDILSTVFTKSMDSDNHEIDNVCNNAGSIIARTHASICEEEFEKFATVYAVKGLTESGRNNKHLVSMFYSA